MNLVDTLNSISNAIRLLKTEEGDVRGRHKTYKSKIGRQKDSKIKSEKKTKRQTRFYKTTQRK